MALLGIVKEIIDNVVIIETIAWPDGIPFPEMIWCPEEIKRDSQAGQLKT